MRIQELTKSYDRNTVVDNVSFEIHKGTVNIVYRSEWGWKIYSNGNDIKTGCERPGTDFFLWKRFGEMEQ